MSDEKITEQKKSSVQGLSFIKGLIIVGILISIIVGLLKISEILNWPSEEEWPLQTTGLNESCEIIFENNCGKNQCVSLRLPNYQGKGLPYKKLGCDDECVNEYEGSLQRNDISYSGPSGGASASNAKCVGFREDLGGTSKSARCLVSLLGEEFRIGKCKSDGWPYNVYLY